MAVVFVWQLVAAVIFSGALSYALYVIMREIRFQSNLDALRNSLFDQACKMDALGDARVENVLKLIEALSRHHEWVTMPSMLFMLKRGYPSNLFSDPRHDDAIQGVVDSTKEKLSSFVFRYLIFQSVSGWALALTFIFIPGKQSKKDIESNAGSFFIDGLSNPAC